jgi:hypothetical protein
LALNSSKLKLIFQPANKDWITWFGGCISRWTADSFNFDIPVPRYSTTLKLQGLEQLFQGFM